MGVSTEEPRAGPARVREREAWLRGVLTQAESGLEQAAADLGEGVERLDAAHERLYDAMRRREEGDARLLAAMRVLDVDDDPAQEQPPIGQPATTIDEPPASRQPPPPAARREPPPAQAGDAGTDVWPSPSPPRTTPWRGRRMLRVSLAGMLALAGALVVTDAVLTWVWKEPMTAFTQSRAQGALKGDLQDLNAAVSAAVRDDATGASAQADAAGTLPAAARSQAAARKAAQQRETKRRVRIADILRHARPGAPIGRLEIPEIGLEQVVVQGTGHEQLAEGVGHYADTSMPGLTGTVGIAGHRTTFGAPFRHVDQLRIGSRIRLRTPYGTYVYKVFGKRIVSPNDAWVLRRGGSAQRLVLTACHPPYSDAQRLVITARLARSPETA
jgi:sortase A